MDPSEFVSGQEPDALLQCQLKLGYFFRNRDLLVSALTHASGADHRLASNERLEFLGDSILGFFVCEELFQRYPSQQEGELTKLKSSVVSRRTCAKVAKRMGLDQFLILGKGMSGPQPVPSSLHADVFEALTAAIYLDGGIEVALRFLREHLTQEIEDAAAGEAIINYKSQLQHLAQRLHGKPPVYLLLQQVGPDHCKTFQVAAQVGDQDYSAAWGRNKKEAEQRAAGNALAEMNGQGPRFDDEMPPALYVPEDAEIEDAVEDEGDLPISNPGESSSSEQLAPHGAELTSLAAGPDQGAGEESA
ncbi:MAG: ribonuclease III [Planctomycetales bacterium]|nr:ribonuclease III [Planctomycetales bacterium]